MIPLCWTKGFSAHSFCILWVFLSTHPDLPSRGYSYIFADVMGRVKGRSQERGLSPCLGNQGGRLGQSPGGEHSQAPSGSQLLPRKGQEGAVILKSHL